MSDRDELQLESALRTHLRRELDGQLGRAEARFLRESQGPAMSIVAPSAAMRGGTGRMRATLLWWAPFAGGIAAAIAIVCGAAAFHSRAGQDTQLVHTGRSSVIPAPASAPAMEEMYSETIDVRTVDEGTVVIEDQGPARQFRREVIDHVEWFDAATNKRIELDIPREEVVLVGMNTY